MASDILQRLRDIYADDDHERGCTGRMYECTCGFDERTFNTAADAEFTIASLRQQLAASQAREAEAYERAAKVAEQFGAYPAPGNDGCGTVVLRSVNGHDIAKAIRALARPSLGDDDAG